MGKAVESKDFLRLEKGASWYDDGNNPRDVGEDSQNGIFQEVKSVHTSGLRKEHGQLVSINAWEGRACGVDAGRRVDVPVQVPFCLLRFYQCSVS